MTNGRVETGIPELDAMLAGGFLPETANLVEGAPGTGKTTLGLQFIYNGITLYDEAGLVFTFDEHPDQYYKDALSYGWDLRSLEVAGKLRIVTIHPETSMAELERASSMIQEARVKRALVDSVSNFRRLSAAPPDLRHAMYHYVTGLKREGLTTILTQESDQLLGSGSQVDDEFAYLVDSYILLRYVEMDSVMKKALLVLKLRGSDHAKDIRQFEITDRGIEVRSKFEGHEGIMSGTPWRMADSFAEAFVRKRRGSGS